MMGLDGIYGTAPVASFKPNAPGINDLGGNALEWMWDGLDEKSGHRTVRGGGWNYVRQGAETPFRGVARSWPMTTLGSVWSEPRASKPRSLPNMWRTHGAL